MDKPFQYMGKVLDGIHQLLNLNAATLSGAVDIVVVEHEDGTLHSTPFHVRFGKVQVIKSNQKIVSEKNFSIFPSFFDSPLFWS